MPYERGGGSKKKAGFSERGHSSTSLRGGLTRGGPNGSQGVRDGGDQSAPYDRKPLQKDKGGRGGLVGVGAESSF